MGKVHLLPGTTFSDVHAKGDWDSQKTSAMAIEELERKIEGARVSQKLLPGSLQSYGKNSPRAGQLDI